MNCALELFIRVNRPLEMIKSLVEQGGAYPTYKDLCVAHSHRRWDVVHYFHKRGLRYFVFRDYFEYLDNASKFLFDNEDELVEAALYYPKFWSIQHTAITSIDLERIVGLARHRHQRVQKVRLIVFATLRRKIGRDVARKITLLMKNQSYVAHGKWGEPPTFLEWLFSYPW